MSRQTDLRSFAEYWLRRPLTPDDAIDVPSSLQLPKALGKIYETFGGCPALTTPHNRLLPPGAIQKQGEYWIFYAENQGVAYWAFNAEDAGADDPIVYQGSEDDDDGFIWYSEEMTMSEWIRVMTLWQIVNGGYENGAYASGIPDAAKIVSAIYPPVGGHPDGSTRFFGADGALLCLAGNESAPSVWAAAADKSAFEALLNRLGFEWDYNSLED